MGEVLAVELADILRDWTGIEPDQLASRALHQRPDTRRAEKTVSKTAVELPAISPAKHAAFSPYRVHPFIIDHHSVSSPLFSLVSARNAERSGASRTHFHAAHAK